MCAFVLVSHLVQEMTNVVERLVAGSWRILNVYAIAAMLGTKSLLCMSLSLKPASAYAEIQLWFVMACPKQCACRVAEAVQTLRNGCTSQCSSPPLLEAAVEQLGAGRIWHRDHNLFVLQLLCSAQIVTGKQCFSSNGC